MHVHAEDQQRARQLAHFLHDILVTLAGGNHLINPRRKRVRPGRSHLQSAAFRGTHQFTARAAHVGIQLVHVRADFRADFDDGLMHLALHLLAQPRRGSFHQFADVRTQFTRRGIHNLEFFFDTNREPVTHERPLPAGDARTSRGVSYSSWAELRSAGEVPSDLPQRTPEVAAKLKQKTQRREHRGLRAGFAATN